MRAAPEPLDAAGEAPYTACSVQRCCVASSKNGVTAVSGKAHKPGLFKDHSGNWAQERRAGHDRRKRDIPFDHGDRRRASRRLTDLEIAEREHKEMIEEALEEFAAEHEQGHP